MKTLIKNVKIFDGNEIYGSNGWVLFDESQVLECGPNMDHVPEAEEVIDGTGKTLTPGLIDGHVHLGALESGAGSSASVKSGALIAAQAHAMRQYGITSVRNCGTGNNADIYVRDMIRSGQIEGARLVACGKVICITGGHGWQMGIECDNADEVRKAARTQIREGADMIKMMATGGMGTKGSKPNVSQLTEEQMRAAVEEAEKVGCITAAHCTGLEGAQNAIRAGVRCIEHAMLDEETAQMMETAGAYYCPTIVTRYNILHITDPKYMWMRTKANPDDLDRKKQALQLCLKHHITICAGTDAGPNVLTPLGKSLLTELNIYREYGLSPIEVLRAATSNNAKMMKIDNITGSIKPGLQADMALFDGDPTEDTKDLEKLCITFQSGKQVWKQN